MNPFCKRSFFFCFFFGIILLLSGCWDRKEVNDLALVRGAGIDKDKSGKIELTVLVNIPKRGGGVQGLEGSGSSGSSGGKQTLIRTAKGATIAEAMSFLQEKLPRQIFWGHCEVFIFNERLAKDGLAETIDFFIRMPQLRDRAQLFVSYQKAQSILSLLPPLERDIAEVVRQLGEHRIGMITTTKDFVQMMLSESGDAAIPWIKILPPIGVKDEKQTIAFINGTAIFKKDKMVGKINDSVTRGLLWIRDEIQKAVVTVQPKKTNGYVSMDLLRAQSEIIPKIYKDKWEVILKAEADDDIMQNTTNLDMSDPEVVKGLEGQLAKEIVNKVNVALTEIQKGMKADVFGFADAFHRQYPDVWKKEKDRWEEIFPNITVTIKPKITIRRQGMNSTLPNTTGEEGTVK